MNLEEAINLVVAIVKRAMTEEHRWAYLASRMAELIAAAKVIVVFSIDMFHSDGRVKLTEGVDFAGAELRVVLSDVLEITDRPQLGPLAWVAIARMIMQLLEQIDSRTN